MLEPFEFPDKGFSIRSWFLAKNMHWRYITQLGIFSETQWIWSVQVGSSNKFTQRF